MAEGIRRSTAFGDTAILDDGDLMSHLRQTLHWYGSIPINTIFSGMNIHLPAILMFTRGTRFWHTAHFWLAHDGIAPGKTRPSRLPVVSGASGQAAKEEQLSAAPTYILRACGWLIRHINMLGLCSHLGCTGFVNQFTGLLQSIIWMIGEHVCHFDSFIDLYFPSRLPCLCWE